MSTADQVLAFIKREFADGRPVTEETPLLGDFVDSVGTFILVSFIEKEFGISLDDSDLTVENLGSVNAISAFIDKRRG